MAVSHRHFLIPMHAQLECFRQMWHRQVATEISVGITSAGNRGIRNKGRRNRGCGSRSSVSRKEKAWTSCERCLIRISQNCASYHQSRWLRQNIMLTCSIRALNRKGIRGSVLECCLTRSMSDCILVQNCTPAHTTRQTQEWCKKSLPGFWAKSIWPRNSPSLNLIENLWANVKEEVNKVGPLTTTESTIENLMTAWANIHPLVLDNIVASMLERIKLVIETRLHWQIV